MAHEKKKRHNRAHQRPKHRVIRNRSVSPESEAVGQMPVKVSLDISMPASVAHCKDSPPANLFDQSLDPALRNIPTPTDGADTVSESALLDALLERTTEEPVFKILQPSVPLGPQEDGNTEDTVNTVGEVVFIIRDVVIVGKDQAQCLEMEGTIGPMNINGFVRESIIHTRLAAPVQKSYKDMVTKNLIAMFQGFILFEDCLTQDAFHNIRSMKSQVLATLQTALGFIIRGKDDDHVLTVIKREYSIARTRKILSELRNNMIPEDPKDPMAALLVQLIDRCMIFEHLKTSMRTENDSKVGWERVEERRKTMEHTLCSPTEKQRLFTECASMLPSDARETTFPRPWTIPIWVQKEKKQESYRYGISKRKERKEEKRDAAQHHTDGTGHGDMDSQVGVGLDPTVQSSQSGENLSREMSAHKRKRNPTIDDGHETEITESGGGLVQEWRKLVPNNKRPKDRP